MRHPSDVPPDITEPFMLYRSKKLGILLSIAGFLFLISMVATLSFDPSDKLILISLMFVNILLIISELFKKIILTNHHIVEERYFIVKRRTTIAFDHITKIQSFMSRGKQGWRHSIASSKDQITVSDYKQWKDILRFIYPRIDRGVFDKDVLRTIGIK